MRRRPQSLFLLGGEYNKNTRALNGDMTNQALNQIHGTICFLGVNAISQHTGLTSTIHAAAAVNQLMASQCKGNVVVVADSSKIGKTAHFVSLKLPEVRMLVTDDGADPAEIAAYRANGVETLIVSTRPVGVVSGEMTEIIAAARSAWRDKVQKGEAAVWASSKVIGFANTRARAVARGRRVRPNFRGWPKADRWVSDDPGEEADIRRR